MADNTRPVELEMVAIPVPMSVRFKDAIESYADAHKVKGDAPSNAELMRSAIASVVKYDLVRDANDRAQYSQRKRYATDAERIAARKLTQESAAKERAEALTLYRSLSKQQAIDALKQSTH